MSGWREEARAQVRLAVPVITLQVGLMLMGVVDTLMMGRVSDAEMAAVGIGNVWHFGIMCFGLGVLQALDPIVSQAFGARDEDAISRAVQRGIVLALTLSLPIAGLILLAEPALTFFEQPAEVIPIAAGYCRVSIFGVPAFLTFVALRQCLQAQHKMRPLVLTIVGANLLNVGLDFVLIHGLFGAPAMGAVGCSLATVIARWSQVVFVLVLAWPLLRHRLLPFRATAVQLGPLWRMLAIGAPIGAQFMAEIGAFNAVALLMGRLGDSAGADLLGDLEVENPGAAAIAGHMVALNLAALAFMVPLGMSMAASVRVGNEIGKGRPEASRLAAKVALAAGLLFMCVTSTLFLFAPELLARAYTSEAGVIAVASALIPLAGVFGVADGLQVVAGGCLRGTGDTRFPALVHLVGFWAAGIPLGWWLAFRADAGPKGLWWGLVTGLTICAVVLIARVRAKLTGDLVRLKIEDEEKEPAADRV